MCRRRLSSRGWNPCWANDPQNQVPRRKGAGAKTVEQTAGRWITYVASPMGKLHGVVAFRQKVRANA